MPLSGGCLIFLVVLYHRHSHPRRESSEKVCVIGLSKCPVFRPRAAGQFVLVRKAFRWYNSPDSGVAGGGTDRKCIHESKVRTLEEAFEQYGVQAEVRVYPEADHAFFNDTRPDVYNAPAAQDAWTRALGLLSRTLKSWKDRESEQGNRRRKPCSGHLVWQPGCWLE